MARPGTLLAFGVLMLGLGVSLLGWYRTWAESGWRRTRWRRRQRGEAEPGSPDDPAPRRWRVHAVFSGAYCVVNGLALLAGGIIRL